MRSAHYLRAARSGPNFTGAVIPSRSLSGSLLADYSVRLGDAIFRHRAELTERATRVRAEITSKVRSEFIANISHELRTPLNSILGFSKMMAGGAEDTLGQGQVAEYAGVIHESAEGLLFVLNDVITISKLQSDRLEVTMDKVDIEELVDASGRWAKARLTGAETRLITHVEQGLPAMFADLRYLQDVLERLLSNAIKFTPDGGTIALFARHLANDRIIICVSDTGIGMTGPEVALALEPFGQVDNRLDRSHGGTGLGLTIAKELIELQGGTLRVASKKGMGTDVVLVFPRFKDDD